MKLKQWTALSVLLLCSLTACGETPNTGKAAVKQQTAVSEQVQKNIINTLEKNYAEQKLKVQSVSETPIAGLYEVIVNGKQMVYVDSKAEYMLVGELINTKSGESLTEARQSELNKVDFARLPLDKAIKEVRGNGKLKVVVFSDADCPFCHRLEREFAKMTDITIYNFMMPIDSLHPDAYAKSMQILCQDNPTKAWTEWMREGKKPAQVAECETSIKENLQLGESLGFSGTPTIVLPNGKVNGGFVPMPKLQQLIEENQ